MQTDKPCSGRKVIWFLCIVAAVHVLFYSAAYPLFNIVDEPSHFDLVVRYSSGYLPRGFEPMTATFMKYNVMYATPEYFNPPSLFPDGKIPTPLWSEPFSSIRETYEERLVSWQAVNHELSQPPLYYLIAGLWWNIWSAFGVEGGDLLYSIRFLNVFFVGALIWLGHLVAAKIFPDNRFVAFGVPVIVSIMPQTAFYSVQSDVLLPLCFGSVFYALVIWSQTEKPGFLLGLTTGLTLAATYLVKLSSVPLLVCALVWVGFQIRQCLGKRSFRAAFLASAGLAIGFGVPVLFWLFRCKSQFGDFTGSGEKIQMLGWVRKDFPEWFDHPVFSISGLWTFLTGLFSTFWQGEFLWFKTPLPSKSLGICYAFLTVLFTGIGLLAAFKDEALSVLQRRMIWFGAVCLFGSVAFLAFLSVQFDFGECFYPSRSHPYFTSGRLMLGALIPFLIVWLYGVHSFFVWLNLRRGRLILVFCFILFVVIAEMALIRPVIGSQYNWFSLRTEKNCDFLK
jgi:hypothetical protein